jgi:hypothetical protein
MVIACYNRGYVHGYQYVGGILGAYDEDIYMTACYNRADVRGHRYVGGIAGMGSVYACYNTGKILKHDTGSSYLGGVLGRGNATDCYWYYTPQGDASDGKGDGTNSGTTRFGPDTDGWPKNSGNWSTTKSPKYWGSLGAWNDVNSEFPKLSWEK